MTFGALLDANVLVPAALRDTLLRAAEARLYRARWSAPILEEVRRTLVSEGLTSADAAARLIAAMRRAFGEAEVGGFEARIAQMTNDPKDRHVLAAAVTASVSVIVTQNVRDFPAAALEPYGIVAQPADAFLLTLFRAEPRVIVRLLREQAGDLFRPPRRVEEVLEALTRDAPGFVEVVWESLRDEQV